MRKEMLFSLIIIPKPGTLDNKLNYQLGSWICLLSLLNTTNIYFGGRYTHTFPQSAGKYEYTFLQSAGKYEYTFPHSKILIFSLLM